MGARSRAAVDLGRWLLDHADSDGFLLVYRSELAVRLGMTPRSVTRALGELVAARLVERDDPANSRDGVMVRLATFPLPTSLAEPTAFLPDGSPVESVLAGVKRRFVRSQMSTVDKMSTVDTNLPNRTRSDESCQDRWTRSERSHTRSEGEKELRALLELEKKKSPRVSRPRRSTARKPTADTSPPERLSDEQRAALDAWGAAREIGVAALRHAEEVTLDWARGGGHVRADWLAVVRNAVRRRWGLDGAEEARSGALGGATRGSTAAGRGRVPASRIMTNTGPPAQPAAGATGGRVDDDW